MKIGIIGGGAAGMMAAVTAARAGAQVAIIEKNDRIGKKILVTGNGKCNLSNLSFSDSCYYSKEKEKAWQLLSRFTPQDTIDFFEGIGLCIKEKNGYLYPACEQAS
ncbi:MAG: NAD(P)-binding protein, partial [Clostridiales bacterium]|nr:NAD(P)-binding protein [Clostridiales bacterium]